MWLCAPAGSTGMMETPTGSVGVVETPIGCVGVVKSPIGSVDVVETSELVSKKKIIIIAAIYMNKTHKNNNLR